MQSTHRRSRATLHMMAMGIGLGCLLAATRAQGAPDDRDEDPNSRSMPVHSGGGAEQPAPPRRRPGKVNVDDRLVPGSKSVDPVRQTAWKAANAQAKRRITTFEHAVKSGNAEAIRKATLDLQSDPLAVQHLNRSGRTDLIDAHNLETRSIQSATKKNIEDEMVRQWNQKNPNDPITAADVEIFEPTNYRKPGEAPKVGQDWDVTVKVRGKDVPSSLSQPVVEESFFKAAGGEKTFGKGTTPKEAAHRQAVEVTDNKSLESYKEPEKILGKDGQAPDHRQRLDNPEDLGRVVEHKSNQAANKAAESRGKGNEVDAVRQDYEQMRQAVKQYDKVSDPRVKAEGGKVGNQVEKGMEVMREVADLKISPEEGRAKLAEMGETPESITRKAAGQVEAAQKLKPQTVGEGSKKQTAGEHAKAQTVDESGKTSTGDEGGRTAAGSDTAAKPDTTARGDAPDTAKTTPDAAKPAAGSDTAAKPDTTARGNVPDTAQPTPDAAKPAAGSDTAAKPDTTARGDAPDGAKATPDGGKTAAGGDTAAKTDTAARGDAPDGAKATPDGGKTAAGGDTAAKTDTAARGDAPDGAKATPDGGKTAAGGDVVTAPDAPDGGRVMAGDAPKVKAPDAPSKVGKAIKTGGGKVIDTAGKVGDAIDIFAGSKDFVDGYKEGDTEKMKEAVVNVADSMTGGTIGTAKMVDERMEAKEQTAREYKRIDKQLEEAKRQQMRVDLRRDGYSQKEADAMVDAYASGDDSAVKDAYQKMGKDIPKAGTAAPTSEEAWKIYGEEVKQNLGDVGTSLKTQAGKAKDFLVETKDNLVEMGTGVLTEKGVAVELGKQQMENLGAENLGVGYEAWKTSRDADKQIDEARQEMEDRLVEKGWSRAKAKVEADHQFDRRESGDTAKELTEQVKENVSTENLKEGYDAWRQNRESKAREADARKELVEKFVGEGFDREEAQEAVDDFYGVNDPEGRADKTKFKEMTRQVRERNLRDAEADGEGGETDDAHGDGDEEGALASFTGKRTERTEGNAESSYGLMAENQNIRQSSTRGEQADADARQIVETAAGDAQQIGEKAAGSTAAAEREGSWGKAIADGVQRGVESGLSAAGSSFGHAAGKQVSDAAFGDPEKKRLEREAAKEPKGDTVEGGDKKTKGAKSGGGKAQATKGKSSGSQVKSGGNKTATSAQKPQTRRAVICKACGSEMTYKGVYYADGTDMYYCPGCKSTMHHVNGPCPWETREVPITSTPAPAATPSPPAPAPTATKPASSTVKTEPKEPAGTLVRCSTPDCPNGIRILMGEIPKTYTCSQCFLKQREAQQGK